MKPPGPTGHPWLGNSPDYERDRLGFLLRCAREYGGIVRFSDETYVVNDPELIGEVLGSNDGPFQMSGNFFSTPRTRDEIATLRQQVAPAFTPTMIERRASSVVSTIAKLAEHYEPEEVVDVNDVMHLITSKVMARFCFGDDSEAIRLSVGALMAALPRGAGNAAALNSYRATLFGLSPLARRRRRIAERRFSEEAVRVVERLRAGDESRDCVVGVLLDADDGADDQERIRRLALVVALAGYGVPALPLAWLQFILAKRPACRARFREEITRVVGDRDPTPADVDTLVYTQAMVKEVLRLYPPTWLLSRYVDRDVTLGGYEMGPGHAVVLSPYVTGRDERYFENADAFVPDRWLHASASARPRYAYFPFGAGAHACIGARFATVEMALALVALEQRVEFAIPPTTHVRPDVRHGLAPLGLQARVVKR